MKTFITLISSILIMTFFTQCGSAQKLDKKTPETITSAFYQNWVGGRPGSSGTLVTIKLENLEKEIVFDSIYFNGKALKLESYLNNNTLTLTGNFAVVTKNNDLIMDADPKKEFGNTVPKLPQKIPFELQKNDAVISYFKKNKKRYFKLTNIKKAKTIYYQ